MARKLEGEVVSVKTEKTAVVLVTRTKMHPIYRKRFIQTKRYLVHDPDNQAKVNQKVVIVETRPLSARKRWKLDKIISEEEKGSKK